MGRNRCCNAELLFHVLVETSIRLATDALADLLSERVAWDLLVFFSSRRRHLLAVNVASETIELFLGWFTSTATVPSTVWGTSCGLGIHSLDREFR